MFRPIGVKPAHPKDGDVYQRQDGKLVQFNHGRWLPHKPKKLDWD